MNNHHIQLVQERIGVLEGQVVEVAELPQIRAELATTQHRATMLQAERDDLQASRPSLDCHYQADKGLA